METKTLTYNVYKFDELDLKAQEKALNYFRENEDFEYLKELLTEEALFYLKKHKLKILDNFKVFYSLSYSQGDGVMFEGKFKFKSYVVTVTHKGNYYHFNNKDLNIYRALNGEIPDKEIELLEEFNILYKDICKTLEKIGYEEIKYRYSEETIKENIEANGYLFKINGDLG